LHGSALPFRPFPAIIASLSLWAAALFDECHSG
jgi:hypothetical protein